MANKEYTTIRIDKEQHEQLAELREETGIPLSEQVRRAVQKWIDERKGEQPKQQ
jgi:predicted DNA-binding protein